MLTKLYREARKFASLNSKEWMQRHTRDQFVKQATADNYRSRAVYKLIEMDQQQNIIKPKSNVLELGCSPGGWTQYIATKLKLPGSNANLVAVDINLMEEVDV